jgi:eukaryotic-like serine/threonine-protein kinase
MGQERDGRTVPERVGPYRIQGTLGQGGMGIVYDAVHTISGRRLAVKTASAVSRKMLAGLRAEVLALRRVNHPNVVAILDEGLAEAIPWYAMDLVEGRTLAELNYELWPSLAPDSSRTTTTTMGPIGDSSISSAPGLATVHRGQPSGATRYGPKVVAAAGRSGEVLKLYYLLCEPLAHVHAQGIVHRDLKPSNVIIRDDHTPVLMDFGLASRVSGSFGRGALDVSNRFLGSVPYVSPEQVRGEFVDARADLYSLGCMLYETLTGRPPFLGMIPKDVLDSHLHEAPRPPSTFADGISPDLDRLVLRLLAKKARDRIGHADDLAAELFEVGGFAVGVRSPSAPVSAVPSYLYRPELAGRAKQLDEMKSWCDDAAEGKGSLILVAGESGIGKTFLAAEIGRQAALDDFNVITGECVPVGTDTGPRDILGGQLHPFRRLLQSIVDRCREGGIDVTERLLGHRGKVLAPYEPAFAGLPGQARYQNPQPLPPEAARRRILSALQETLERMADDAPLLVILDDLQWADELSLSFLESLPERFFDDKRLLLLGLFRPEETGAPLEGLLRRKDFRTLKLDPLDHGALESMVSDMLGMRRSPAALARFLWRQSEGNPFFASEYLRVVASEGLVQRRGGTWVLTHGAATDEGAYDRLQLPGSLRELVGRRLGGLALAERTLIEAAAVLGREFDDELLEMVSQSDESVVVGVLRDLTTRDVLEALPAGRHRFVHETLRAVAYADTPQDRRKGLHRVAGLALESRLATNVDQHFAELAHHFREAGEKPKTLEYLERAAYQALSRFANVEAEHFFTELIEQGAGTTLGHARWEKGLGDALHGRGAFDRAREHLERACTLLGHPLPRGKAQLSLSLLGQLFQQVGHRVFPESEVAHDATKKAHFREASQAYDRLLQIFYYRGLPQEMFYATLKTLNLAEIAGPSPELATAYSIAHAVAGIMPVRSLADRYLELANQVLEKTPDKAVESYLHLLAGVYRSGTAEWERAKDAFDLGLSLATSLGFHRRVDEINLGLANWNFLRGKFGEALRYTGAELVSARRGDPQAQAWQILMRNQVQMALGHPGDGQSLSEVERLIPQLQRSELLWTYALLANAALGSGASAEAQRYAELGLGQVTSGPPVTFYCIQAYSGIADVFLELWRRALRGRDPDQGALAEQAWKACRALKGFARVFPAARPRWALGEGLRQELRGRPSKARALWQQGLRHAKALRLVYDEAIVEWMLARSSLNGERAPQLARVLHIAKQLDVRYLVDRVQADLDSGNQSNSSHHGG